MRYNHFDMLPEKAFQPVGKRMTLEGGGGVGKVVSTAASIGMGQSPLGAFGSTLGSQVIGDAFGGRGGRGAPGMGGDTRFGLPRAMGGYNQTPFGGGNPASIANDNRFGLPRAMGGGAMPSQNNVLPRAMGGNRVGFADGGEVYSSIGSQGLPTQVQQPMQPMQQYQQPMNLEGLAALAQYLGGQQ